MKQVLRAVMGSVILGPIPAFCFNWASEPTQLMNQELLKAIKSLTETIDANAAQIRADQDMIRAVLVEKQKFTLALTRLSLLQQSGVVLTKVAPTAQILSEVNAMVSVKDGQTPPTPVPITLAAMPSLSMPSQAIATVKGIFNTAQDLPNQARAIANSFGDLFAGIANVQSPWGILDLAEQGAGVLDQAGNLVSSVSGIYQSVNQLIYTGKSFIGTDWGDIDSVKTALGGTLALDREAPEVQIPVVGKLAAALSDAQSGYQAALRAYEQGRELLDAATSGFPRRPLGRFVPGSAAARRAASYALGDGVHLRPEGELDAAYFHMVQTGDEASRLMFYAATTQRSGSCYDPIVGAFTDGEKTQRVNLNDVLSGGAFTAVERYRAATRTPGANAYAGFAAALAPASAAILESAPAGKRIEVTREMVNRAGTMPPVNLRQYGSLVLRADPHAGERLFADAIRAWEARRGPYRPIANSPGTRTAGVVVMGLPGRDQAEYDARIRASDARISQNSRMLNICVSTLNYSQHALEAVTRLRAALQGLAAMATQSNAIESLPAMIQNCDFMILFLQRQISDYSLEVERLHRERNAELGSRGNFVRKTREELEQNARLRISNLLLHSVAAPSRSGSGSGVSQGVGPDPGDKETMGETGVKSF